MEARKIAPFRPSGKVSGGPRCMICCRRSYTVSETLPETKNLSGSRLVPSRWSGAYRRRGRGKGPTRPKLTTQGDKKGRMPCRCCQTPLNHAKTRRPKLGKKESTQCVCQALWTKFRLSNQQMRPMPPAKNSVQRGISLRPMHQEESDLCCR